MYTCIVQHEKNYLFTAIFVSSDNIAVIGEDAHFNCIVEHIGSWREIRIETGDSSCTTINTIGNIFPNGSVVNLASDMWNVSFSSDDTNIVVNVTMKLSNSSLGKQRCLRDRYLRCELVIENRTFDDCASINISGEIYYRYYIIRF